MFRGNPGSQACNPLEMVGPICGCSGALDPESCPCILSLCRGDPRVAWALVAIPVPKSSKARWRYARGLTTNLVVQLLNTESLSDLELSQRQQKPFAGCLRMPTPCSCGRQPTQLPVPRYTSYFTTAQARRPLPPNCYLGKLTAQCNPWCVVLWECCGNIKHNTSR